MGLKESREQLRRLEKEHPVAGAGRARARAARYLLLRRRYEEALPLLEECLSEPPLAVVGWARAHGVLARVPATRSASTQRAREVCQRALAQLVPSRTSTSPA